MYLNEDTSVLENWKQIEVANVKWHSLMHMARLVKIKLEGKRQCFCECLVNVGLHETSRKPDAVM